MPHQVSMMGWVGLGEDFCGLVGLGPEILGWVGLVLEKVTHGQLWGGDAVRPRRFDVGLVSHWPCVTDSVVYPPIGSVAWEKEMEECAMVTLLKSRWWNSKLRC